MKRILFLVVLFQAAFISAQNQKSADEIAASYDLKRLTELQNKLYLSDLAKENRIDVYLVSHPNEKRQFVTQAGTIFQMDDIIAGKPMYKSTDNALAALGTHTTALQPGGELGLSLQGEGMIIGVWDGGYARKTHVEFQNSTSTATRVTFPDTPISTPTSVQHATHVMGTIGAKGVDESAKGMAPLATLRSYNWDFDANEVTTAASAGLLISNHSYGVPLLDDEGDLQVPAWMPGCYDSSAVEWDDIANSAPFYLMVTSAGNEGQTSYTGGTAPGYDKLTGEKNAKNNLVIANANPDPDPITGELISLSINTSSSQGPSDDRRIKPDIAGDGTGLYSSSNETDTSYAVLSGTSMASPNVSGSLLLLQQLYFNLHGVYMRAATLKGLVCDTAFDDPQKAGPDAKFGWGLLNTRDAAQVLLNDMNSQALVLESSLANNGQYTLVFNSNGATDIRATLSWTDPTGNDQSGEANSTTPVLVNDLDLRITGNSTTYFPWKLQTAPSASAIQEDNIVDNVERVDLGSAPAGTYTVTVSHKGSLSGGNQNFSLILSGQNIALGTNDLQFAEMRIWPNPVSDVVNISFDQPVSGKLGAKLYDIQGREMKMYSELIPVNGSNYTLNMSDMPRGVYFISLTNGDQVYKKKIIKK